MSRIKITDIFSYVRQITAVDLENLFYQIEQGTNKKMYQISYSQEDLELSNMQLLAVKELLEGDKRAAYIVYEKKLLELLATKNMSNLFKKIKFYYL